MKHLFNGIYNNKRVLVTGHSGFKGSWLLLWLQQLGAVVKGFALEPDTKPAHIELLKLFDSTSIGDIKSSTQVNAVFQSFQPEIVFHLAAQPLVRYSYQHPVATFATNVIGTAHVLEAAKNTPSVKVIVNITTDKVYENFEWVWPYKETDRLGGHDPYSTSKACAELVHESYRRSFFKEAGILSATARAGNVIGGGDWAADRLIPDIVRASTSHGITEIRNPESIRPWQHVLDPLSGYLQLGMYLLQGNKAMEGSWNFGPDSKDCISVRQVLDEMNKCWDDIEWADVSAGKKVHEANLLRLDCSKALFELNWQPVWNVRSAIEHTANWYKAWYQNNTVTTLQQLQEYAADAKSRSLSWATAN